jgi:adenylate cyclase
MESNSKPGLIQVPEETYEMIKDLFLFEERGEIDVKGIFIFIHF